MKSKIFSVLLALVLVLSFSLVTAVPVGAATPTTIASSTMVFQSVGGYTLAYDPATGIYEGMIPMVETEPVDLGDGVAGFDLFAREGATAWFGDDPGTGEVWTSQVIADNDAWPTYDVDTPDWYQYSLKFYEEEGVQKWRVANHSGATEADPWSGGGGSGAVEQGVPMSGTMDWNAMYAAETDAGEYLYPIDPETHPEIPRGAATKGGGPACWDMDWSWGSEVVPLQYGGFAVAVTGTGPYTVTLTSAAGPVTNTNTGVNYGTIQSAIDCANPGDIISVAAGTYAPFTVDGKTDLTIQADGVVTVQGVQSVATAYTDRDCVVFVKGSTNIVLNGLDIQGQSLGTINSKNYGVIYENSSGEIKGCTVSPNTVGDMLSIAIGIWDSSEVTVNTCTAETFGRVGVFIYNGCAVDIIRSSIEGQVYTGEGEVCYGIEVEGAYDDATPGTGSQVTIRGNEIYNCDNTFYEAPTWQSGGVYINGWMEYFDAEDSTVIVENNDIHHNYSGIIVIKSPSSYAHTNNIYDNRAFGVESLPAHDQSTAVFDATENWWGDPSGPQHADNPTGTGDVVSDGVDFDPWLETLSDLTVTTDVCTPPTTSLVVPGIVTATVPFTISGTTTNPSDGKDFTNVRFNITLTGPVALTGNRVDTFTITDVFLDGESVGTQGINDTFGLEGEDAWVGYWGPETGFPMVPNYGVTTEFTVEMPGTAPVGSYTVLVELVDIDENSDVVAFATQVFTLSERIGIELLPTSINFGQVLPGLASVPQSLGITNIGTVDVIVDAETESLFYNAALTIDGDPLVGETTVWSQNIATGVTHPAQLVVTVPLDWTAGVETGTIVFWVEAQ